MPLLRDDHGFIQAAKSAGTFVPPPERKKDEKATQERAPAKRRTDTT